MGARAAKEGLTQIWSDVFSILYDFPPGRFPGATGLPAWWSGSDAGVVNVRKNFFVESHSQEPLGRRRAFRCVVVRSPFRVTFSP